MTGKNSLIQASASISNIFVDSLMQTVLFFSKDGLKDSDKKSFKTFEDFISGQCLEATILGTILFIISLITN